MKSWVTMDKAEWEGGPWMTEPDKASWTDEKTGYPCLIVRNHQGALCGYVGIEETHPDFKKDYMDIDGAILVHGGLTFADRCQHSDDPSIGICHIPDPGKSDNIWWFGFDCSHSFDYAPAYEKLVSKYVKYLTANAIYRNFVYVKAQVRKLARQLKRRELPA